MPAALDSGRSASVYQLSPLTTRYGTPFAGTKVSSDESGLGAIEMGMRCVLRIDSSDQVGDDSDTRPRMAFVASVNERADDLSDHLVRQIPKCIGIDPIT